MPHGRSIIQVLTGALRARAHTYQKMYHLGRHGPWALRAHTYQEMYHLGRRGTLPHGGSTIQVLTRALRAHTYQEIHHLQRSLVDMALGPREPMLIKKCITLVGIALRAHIYSVYFTLGLRNVYTSRTNPKRHKRRPKDVPKDVHSSRTVSKRRWF